MIAITSESGELLKAVPFESGKRIGYNRQLGFVSGESAKERQNNRKRHGFKALESFDFQFELAGQSEIDFLVEAPTNCKAEKRENAWFVQDGSRSFELKLMDSASALPVTFRDEKRDYAPLIILAFLLIALPVAYFLLPKTASAPEAPVVVDQVTVQIKKEVQKPVEVTSVLDRLPEVKRQAPVAKRAINQNLGFLGLLGRKDLKKAVGGVPTKLNDVSPGAGPGGKHGSGGQLLVGLGEGLKRTTVGNTGVAGLGGIGTRGAGGGAGGYGNSAIGSGEGKALSSVPLSQELVLEGGLDRSVVQATIAKYLSQVRACYEAGLQRNPGLGGQVTMNFEIGGSGNLNYAHVGKTSLNDQQVETCISQRMMGWVFPKPRGGVNVKVSYPFVLRSIHS